MWDLLEDIKDAISNISTVKTVSIGLENGLSAKDCPAVRIITERSYPMDNPYFDQGDIQVVILFDLKNNLEEVYKQSIALEKEIRAAERPYLSYVGTDYDQDSVTVFKATIIRFKFRGVKNEGTECN